MWAAIGIGLAAGLTAAFLSALAKAAREVREERWDGLEPVPVPREYRR